MTARYDAANVGSDEAGPPRPEGPVQLLESVENEADGRRWTVQLSWPVSDERPADEGPESTATPADD
ncbi:hypothetical protein [Halosimplex salinum]|uniref:hypothetical protein n=1 Tax=Halosimplex salinum TaxID=1710538 RepID=UPI001F3A6761|nr:hypothetical protein [Halosimplex salinum]